jgi:hypothetical protein
LETSPACDTTPFRATHLIADIAGVEITGVPGRCRACGQISAGEVFASWVRPTFTDHDKLFPGEIICARCLFCFDDHNQALAQRVGKQESQRFRNYSHFVLRGEWIAISKASRRLMYRLLLEAPEVAVIAISGQRHLAFRCPVGWWQIEEKTSRPFPLALQRCMQLCDSLYAGGITKTEIETGHYRQKSVQAFGLEQWRDLEARLRGWRGSLCFRLAVFLLQREDNEEEKETDAA